MRYALAIAVVLLILAHQDYWQWNDASLEFGFLPGCLAWHMGVSVLASLVWLLAVLFAWPIEDEDARPKLKGDDDG